MKKLLILLSVLYAAIPSMALEKGDSLAILYWAVWAYEKPGDFSTRLGPYDYGDRRMVYLETSTDHKGWYKVITPDGNEAFIKASRVSSDPSLTHDQVKQDIKDGLRDWRYGLLPGMKKAIIFSSWKVWLIMIAVLAVLYFFKRYYPRIDWWICSKVKPAPKPLLKPWFISYSLGLGLVLGILQQIVAPTETEWFLSEGISIWANYPSSWDWVLWLIFWSFVGILIGVIIQAFKRFPFPAVIFYALFTLVLSLVYFFAGMYTGGLAAILLIMFGMGSSGGSRPSSMTVDGKVYDHVGGNTYRER